MLPHLHTYLVNADAEQDAMIVPVEITTLFALLFVAPPYKARTRPGLNWLLRNLSLQTPMLHHASTNLASLLKALGLFDKLSGVAHTSLQ